ncbi:hypothetical protein [Peribacillus butanolivorans]|uniref:hypothetical protein n=1 Tax=Peribacillus butanolivorans TaxID=421767 RepID=UPI003652F341
MEHIYEGRAIWIYPDDFDVDQIAGVQSLSERDYSNKVILLMIWRKLDIRL